MPSVNENGKRYWQNLEEFSKTDEFQSFVEAEFPTEAEVLEPSSRRRFLQLMGASMALAGLTACRWPKEEILPYANRPDGTMPGVPRYFATSMEINGVAHGLLAKSFDGRPIKIEGNPTDPNSGGATHTWAQASVLDLYDPNRVMTFLQKKGQQAVVKTRDDFDKFVAEHFGALKTKGGKGLYFLSEISCSNSVQHMKDHVRAVFPESKWMEYEPIHSDNLRAGSQLAYGGDLRPHYQIDRAKTIVSLDADILGTHPAAVKQIRDFTKGRSVEDGNMNRLYAIESQFTVTGAMADHRLALRGAEIERLVLELAAELLLNHGLALGPDYQAIKTELRTYTDIHTNEKFVKAIAEDLAQHSGASLLVAGRQHSPLVHALVHLMNRVLDSVGEDKPVYYTIEERNTGYVDANSAGGELAAIQALQKALEAGSVETLVIIGGNPAYDAPADLNFASLIEKAGTSVHLSVAHNETGRLCNWLVPRAHYLEAWGDTRGYNWAYQTAQPLIDPLYNGLSTIEFLAAITDYELKTGYEIVRKTIADIYPPSQWGGLKDFEDFWRTTLNTGVLGDSYHRTKILPLELAKLQTAIREADSETARADQDHLDLVFTPDPCMYDGRFADNGWLQELPDFITKMTWDNAAFIAPATAKELGIEMPEGELVKLRHQGKELEIAVYVHPGLPQHTVVLPLGYGRTAAGDVGSGAGFNTYTLRTSDAMDFASGATIERTGRSYELATTQAHFQIDRLGMEERQSRIKDFIREGTYEHYQEHPDFAQHEGHAPAPVLLWEPHTYDNHKWGMAIDLNACTGCNACVVACQSENNIPVVGKEQVLNGREMHWMRIDRYFAGEPDAPEVVQQPMACAQCENAPCEQVCPVGATMHDKEGLNVMVYNRCIGTRYCLNNCPFKVRRFNFFYFHKEVTDIQKMAFNPEVTVRTRGVMEKCTYCTQRIQAVKIKSRNERRPIHDGEIVPACAQSCPAQAIVFGDLNDETSEVTKLHKNSRNYTLLDELMLKTRTVYLARVRNPNPRLVEEANDGSQHS